MATSKHALRTARTAPGHSKSPCSPRFGKALKAAYVRRHGEMPGTARRFIDGAQRDVAVYTEADRDLFDAVWSEIGGAS
jgi:hypothetical protein